MPEPKHAAHAGINGVMFDMWRNCVRRAHPDQLPVWVRAKFCGAKVMPEPEQAAYVWVNGVMTETTSLWCG
jgi:hypothetical protein